MSYTSLSLGAIYSVSTFIWPFFCIRLRVEKVALPPATLHGSSAVLRYYELQVLRKSIVRLLEFALLDRISLRVDVAN